MYQIDFNHPSSIYFVGIGGISMSGLAEILKDAGFRVSGSDRSKSPSPKLWKERGSMYFMDNVPGILPMISIVSYLPARFTKTILNMSLLWKRDPASHQSAAFRRDHAELQDPYCHQRYSRQDHHDLHGQ